MPPPTHIDTVLSAKNAVIAKFGHSFTQSPCGAFEITKTTAWMLRNNGEGIGLVNKPSGNNCNGYSVDGLMYTDGLFVDILIDSGGTNTPAWGFKDPINPADWRLPIDPDNPVPNPPTPPPGGNVIPYDEAKSIEFGVGCNNVYDQTSSPIDAGMISVMSQRAAWDYYVGGLTWEESKIKHINELRAVYGLPPI